MHDSARWIVARLRGRNTDPVVLGFLGMQGLSIWAALWREFRALRRLLGNRLSCLHIDRRRCPSHQGDAGFE